MREYISGWWSGLSPRGRAVVSVTVAVCLLAAFGLALGNAGAFDQVADSLRELLR